MKTRWIGVAATALIVAAGPAGAGRDGIAPPGATDATPEAKRAAALSASASAALATGEPAKAVRDAEAAALLLPRDAGTRALLGRAYLAAGRFASAETAFTDALTLDPSIARAAVNRALAQIALGKVEAARSSLAMAEGLAPDADIGLAQALLGDGEGARQRLDAAARIAGADARTRQNLGLAYALEGRWNDAVAVAQQDVPADVMPQRLRRWAMIAQLKGDPAMQVGAILGVLPVIDGGEPAALALVVPVAAPVQVAVAPPEPTAPAALAEATAQPVAVPVTPIVHTENGTVVTQIDRMPPPIEALIAPPFVIPQAAVPVAQSVASASVPAVAPSAVVPKIVAWAGPPLMRSGSAKPAPARWGEHAPAEAKPVKTAAVIPAVAIMPVAPKPILRASQITLKPALAKSMGNWAVQLGAFSSAQRTQVAWSRLSGKAAYMSAYTPTGSGRRWGKVMLYRLSVSGLASRADAVNLCVRIKASGGACFVRNVRGDRPMQWAAGSRADEPA